MNALLILASEGGANPVSFQTLPAATAFVVFGVVFHEWKGAGKKTHSLIALGIGTLIISTVIIGIGTWLKGQG